MQNWILLALITLFLWGIWGFFSKLTMEHLKPMHAIPYEVVGEILIGLVVLLLIKRSFSIPLTGSSTGILAGAAWLLGALTFFAALRKGKPSIIVPLTALYPGIGIILGFLVLKERLSAIQCIGIFLALIASYLLAHETNEKE